MQNPVLTRELYSVLRSIRGIVLLAILLSALSALVFVAWQEDPEGFTHGQQENLAQNLFTLFATGSMVMVAILAPVFSAGSITLEKERRTWDLLQTTPVSTQSIAGGKLLASLTYLVLMLVGTLPVLSVCFLLPGVDPVQVPMMYVILVCVALTFGMIGLMLSAYFDRTQAALTTTYLVVMPLALALMAASLMLEHLMWQAGSAIVAVMLAIVINMFLYVTTVRRLRKPYDPAPPSIHEEDISQQGGLVLVRNEFPDNLLVPSQRDELMDDGVNPIREKELRHEVFGRGTLFVRVLIMLSMSVSVPFMISLYAGNSSEWLFVDYLLLFVMLVGPAFACSSFTKEKEYRTLDMLRTTLIRPWPLVWGKFYTPTRVTLVLTGLLSTPLVLAAIFQQEDYGPWRIELLGYLWIVVLTLVVSITFGLVFSMIMKTTLASMVTTYVVILLLFLAPIAVMYSLTRMFATMDLNRIGWYTFTSPLLAAHSINQWPPDTVGPQQPVWLLFSIVFVVLTGAMMVLLYLGAKRLLRVQ